MSIETIGLGHCFCAYICVVEEAEWAAKQLMETLFLYSNKFVLIVIGLSKSLILVPSIICLSTEAICDKNVKVLSYSL